MALPDTDAAVQGLIDYVDASPSPFHAARTAARLLAADGFVEVDEAEPFPTEPGRQYLVRGGSLVAWSTQDRPHRPVASFRVVGAHTDSQNLRIKPNPDQARPRRLQGPTSSSRSRVAKSGIPGGIINERGSIRETGSPGSSGVWRRR